MIHNKRCENARREKCECSCKGAKHKMRDEEEYVQGERVMVESMGGEVADFLRSVRGMRLPDGVTFCLHGPQIDVFHGYPHDGGIADAAGNKWWVYAKCDECHYAAAWWKIARRMVIT